MEPKADRSQGWQSPLPSAKEQKAFRILLVENNALYRKALAVHLQSRFPLWQVAKARDGRDARRKIGGSPPDLILTDISLPGENGLILTRRLKAQFPQIIVIILSHSDLPEYREAAALDGADYFVPKEFYSGEEIISLVESVLCTAPGADGR